MKIKQWLAVGGCSLLLAAATGSVPDKLSAAEKSCNLQPVIELSLGSQLGQLRAVPVSLGPGAPRAFLAVYGEDSQVDPYVEMFFFPKGTLKFALFDERGDIIWRKDLGRGVVPPGSARCTRSTWTATAPMRYGLSITPTGTILWVSENTAWSALIPGPGNLRAAGPGPSPQAGSP